MNEITIDADWTDEDTDIKGIHIKTNSRIFLIGFGSVGGEK